MFSRAIAIAYKDITSELRSREMLGTAFTFILLIMVIFGLAMDASDQRIKEYIPGIIWVSYFFAGVILLARSFALERENDCLQGLMLIPADRSSIYFGKVMGNLAFMLAVEIVSMPIFSIIFNYSILNLFPKLLVLIVLATLGYVLVGTFLSALTESARMSQLLLPVLLFPLEVPVIIAAVRATGIVLAGRPLAEAATWLKVLGAYSAIFAVLSYMLFDFILES